ncbi:hypothetical protein [Micromonospora sp. NBRC 101691]|uniref:hypothetical protein n=1 Tax=Micromonospora sp. NBRC 101691 TaxID=3032198 RepID=UPI0024A1F2BF|nr:hypothetical protein [Micromonospora sp. NBRC 101691]GLY21700.1 hypothetical protein Misp04_14320 [Micromonospora sp. NBRC 101691]
MTDPNALLTGARLPEDEVRICTRLDLVTQWRRLAEELAAAKVRNTVDPRIAGGDVSDLAERMEALRAEVEASTVTMRVRALSPKAWNELAETHPPRPDDEEDARMTVNRATFLPVLVRASTYEPELTEETWAKLLDLGSGLLDVQQWRTWWRTCWNLNMRPVDLPFSVAGLLTTLDSGSESGSPEPSA